jgi:hypothetical protein
VQDLCDIMLEPKLPKKSNPASLSDNFRPCKTLLSSLLELIAKKENQESHGRRCNSNNCHLSQSIG